MDLVYRGIKYRSKSSQLTEHRASKPFMTYQKLDKKATVKSCCLWLDYCRHLFSASGIKLSFAEFWHYYQCDRLNLSWEIDLIKMLDSCWQKTIVIELEKSDRARIKAAKKPVELKYRGITYYRYED